MSCAYRYLLSSSLMFLIFSQLGCLEPSREDYRDDLAQASCERLEACGNIPGSYDSFDDCIVEKRADFNDLWPASKCDNGRINEARAEDCIKRAESYSCNSNFLDDLAFVNECRADKVCIDPAN